MTPDRHDFLCPFDSPTPFCSAVSESDGECCDIKKVEIRVTNNGRVPEVLSMEVYCNGNFVDIQNSPDIDPGETETFTYDKEMFDKLVFESVPGQSFLIELDGEECEECIS